MATERFLLSASGEVIRRIMVYNPAETSSREGGRILFHSEQDATDIVEQVKRDRDVDQRKRTFRLAARVPAVIYEKAVREGWHNDRVAWARFLNDPDNRDFRVGGRL